jgi:hypothetical protein
MKKFVKAIGIIALACVCAAGGYEVGHKTDIGSVVSAVSGNVIESTPSAEVTEPTAQESDASQAENAAKKEQKQVIEKNTQTAAEGLSEITSVPAQFGDTAADVKLYTSAQKDENGEFLWDDGNRWVLEVTADGSYTLLDEYVQLGSVDIMVGDEENGGQTITAVISTNAGLRVKKFTYNGTAFESETVYNSGVLNVSGTTF